MTRNRSTTPARREIVPQIILVRHGKPNLDSKDTTRLDWRQYRQWWQQYEQAPLLSGQGAPEELQRTTKNAPFLFASPRPRAIETAQALADNREIRTDWIFVEAAMPSPPMPEQFRFRPFIWNFLARTSWLLGYAGGNESRKQACIRAETAAEILHMATRNDSDAILVAHGWFNRMLWLPLLERGWYCVHNSGDDFWSYRIYQQWPAKPLPQKQQPQTTANTAS